MIKGAVIFMNDHQSFVFPRQFCPNSRTDHHFTNLHPFRFGFSFIFPQSRFDVRGYLNAIDLQKYEAKIDVNYNDLLTEEEIDLERKLDKERYRDLDAVEPQVNDESNHEDELRRLKESIEEDDKKYNQIQFDYDNLEQSVKNENVNSSNSYDLHYDSTSSRSSTDKFILPVGLHLPDDIQRPATKREHNLIEKTARFISKQDVQMEILLKTKQSSNSQFNFLSM